jgi:hypothetical protein
VLAQLCTRQVVFADDLVRNIPGIRVSQALFDDLVRDPEDEAVAVAAEALGRMPTPAPAITRPFDYGTVIAYSFDASNWQATRFGDGRSFGVWYGSLELETTVYETVFHAHRFIVDSFPGLDRDVVRERRVFDVRCEALLVDLRGRESTHPDLVSRTSYSFTQALGRFLQEQGQNGLLVQSARWRGTNAAVFSAQRLSNVRDKLFLTYRINPARDRVIVEREPGVEWLAIAPSTLA